MHLCDVIYCFMTCTYLDYSGLYSAATVEVYIHVYWFLNFECGVASIS
ncbi:hypothetical protein MtrunA17_Chr3g0132331 [Medicago truncatula]|uniref:Uncharacterized protein n=1 Tax=Medicago truncatula TaxID=3880 RepID=A0A396J186_MEDTR|nr:hypothetical protein MtrunA17_Chr3g0132331 [Medicago truncatula]